MNLGKPETGDDWFSEAIRRAQQYNAQRRSAGLAPLPSVFVERRPTFDCLRFHTPADPNYPASPRRFERYRVDFFEDREPAVEPT
jgi:hypothetical protein